MAAALINSIRRIAKTSYGATVEEARDVSKTLRDAADLIEQQAARIAELEADRTRLSDGVKFLTGRISELERDLADQRDKHACVLRLMKCDEDFIALQIASVAKKKGKE